MSTSYTHRIGEIGLHLTVDKTSAIGRSNSYKTLTLEECERLSSQLGISSLTADGIIEALWNYADLRSS